MPRSAAASSAIAAASGSWKTLNSADAVALPTSAAAAHEDDLRDAFCRLGIRAQQEGDVGERGEGDERHGTSLGGGLTAYVTQQLDGVARVGARLGRRPAEVAHAVVAVHVPRVDGVLEQRPGGSPGDRHVGAAGCLQHDERVAHDVVDGGVAADARDRAQVEVGVQRREQQRARVVDAGVDVEHDRDGAGGVGGARHLGKLPFRRGGRAGSGSGGARLHAVRVERCPAVCRPVPPCPSPSSSP